MFQYKRWDNQRKIVEEVACRITYLMYKENKAFATVGSIGTETRVGFGKDGGYNIKGPQKERTSNLK